MGADDASALRFDQANHHLQYGVVTARQKRADDRRHFGDHLQVRADFPPFGTACHATGKNHAVDAMRTEKQAQAFDIANTDRGIFEL